MADPRDRLFISSLVYRYLLESRVRIVSTLSCGVWYMMRRTDRTVSMSQQKSRRDSDLVLSHFGHLKEHLFKFLVIGDYGVGELPQ